MDNVSFSQGEGAKKEEKRPMLHLGGGGRCPAKKSYLVFLHTHCRFLAKNKNVSLQVSSSLIKIFSLNENLPWSVRPSSFDNLKERLLIALNIEKYLLFMNNISTFYASYLHQQVLKEMRTYENFHILGYLWNNNKTKLLLSKLTSTSARSSATMPADSGAIFLLKKY